MGDKSEPDAVAFDAMYGVHDHRTRWSLWLYVRDNGKSGFAILGGEFVSVIAMIIDLGGGDISKVPSWVLRLIWITGVFVLPFLAYHRMRTRLSKRICELTADDPAVTALKAISIDFGLGCTWTGYEVFGRYGELLEAGTLGRDWMNNAGLHCGSAYVWEGGQSHKDVEQRASPALLEILRVLSEYGLADESDRSTAPPKSRRYVLTPRGHAERLRAVRKFPKLPMNRTEAQPRTA